MGSNSGLVEDVLGGWREQDGRRAQVSSRSTQASEKHSLIAAAEEQGKSRRSRST